MNAVGGADGGFGAARSTWTLTTANWNQVRTRLNNLGYTGTDSQMIAAFRSRNNISETGTLRGGSATYNRIFSNNATRALRTDGNQVQLRNNDPFASQPQWSPAGFSKPTPSNSGSSGGNSRSAPTTPSNNRQTTNQAQSIIAQKVTGPKYEPPRGILVLGSRIEVPQWIVNALNRIRASSSASTVSEEVVSFGDTASMEEGFVSPESQSITIIILGIVITLTVGQALALSALAAIMIVMLGPILINEISTSLAAWEASRELGFSRNSPQHLSLEFQLRFALGIGRVVGNTVVDIASNVVGGIGNFVGNTVVDITNSVVGSAGVGEQTLAGAGSAAVSSDVLDWDGWSPDGIDLPGLKEQLGNIMRGFGYGACLLAANAIAQELRRRRIEFEIITLEWLPRRKNHFVYSDILAARGVILPRHPGISESSPGPGVVATTGIHVGVTVFPDRNFARTFCNAHKLGLRALQWFRDFHAAGQRVMPPRRERVRF